MRRGEKGQEDRRREVWKKGRERRFEKGDVTSGKGRRRGEKGQ